MPRRDATASRAIARDGTTDASAMASIASSVLRSSARRPVSCVSTSSAVAARCVPARRVATILPPSTRASVTLVLPMSTARSMCRSYGWSACPRRAGAGGARRGPRSDVSDVAGRPPPLVRPRSDVAGRPPMRLAEIASCAIRGLAALNLLPRSPRAALGRWERARSRPGPAARVTKRVAPSPASGRGATRAPRMHMRRASAAVAAERPDGRVRASGRSTAPRASAAVAAGRRSLTAELPPAAGR